MKTPPKPTSLNVWALAQLFGDADQIPAVRVPATSHPHLKRCLNAGLFVIEGGLFKLTAAGRAAIVAGGVA